MALGASAVLAAGKIQDDPNRDRARNALTDARDYLEKAANDKGDRRDAAMDLIDRAKDEINLSAQYIAAHPGKS